MKPALVYDARIDRWRYLGRMISTAAGNAMAARQVAEGRGVDYIDPSGVRARVEPAEVIAYPVPRMPREAKGAPPVVLPPDMIGPEIGIAVGSRDPAGILAEVFGVTAGDPDSWSSRYEPRLNAAILDGPGIGYQELANAIQGILNTPALLAVFEALPRLHILFHVLKEEGGYDWIPGSFAIRGDVGLIQAFGSLADWATRYKGASVIGCQIGF